MISIEQLLIQYAQDPQNPEKNFGLAYAYELAGQTAAAVSFYLRAAEKSEKPILSYEALIRCAKCFNSQGSRTYTTRGLLQHAISLLPDRPEAYYLMSKFHESNSEWQDCYVMSSIGLSVADNPQEGTMTDLGYVGKYGLLFQKGVASWWVGLSNQARYIMLDLKQNYALDAIHSAAVASNINNIGHPASPTWYSEDKGRSLRFKFAGYERIKKNHSQSFQDIFVLSMLNGKMNGTYLEVGSSFPFHTNNTALLETEFGWRGLSMDIDRSTVEQFFRERRNTVLCLDATKVDFEQLLASYPFGNDFDYLQLDADPPQVTLEILKRIPFHKYRFAVITFEHDHYRDGGVREESRTYLKSLGYRLVVSDVAFNKEKNSFEDWWVHPALVDPEIVARMEDLSESPKFCTDYMFGEFSE